MAYLTKNDIEYITKNITPEETEYVTGITSTLNDVCKNSDIPQDKSDDIIFLTKLLSFSAKFNLLYTVNNVTDYSNNEYRNNLGDIKYRMEDYIREIQENIQSIIGIINKSDITKITLPVSDNPLEVLNELKICLNNWYTLRENDIEYVGCKFITSQFLSFVHRAIYLFRICKQVKCTDEPCECTMDYNTVNYMKYGIH